MKKLIALAVYVISIFNSKLKIFYNSKNQPRKFNYLLKQLMILVAIATLASCGSKSGQRVKEIEAQKKAIADSLSQTEQEMKLRTFRITSVQTEVPYDNETGNGQYPEIVFSVRLIILDSVMNKYNIYLAVAKQDVDFESKLTDTKSFFKEMTEGNHNGIVAEFEPRVKNDNGYTGQLYVKKYYPNSGNKIGNALVIDEHTDIIYGGTTKMDLCPEKMAKLH